MEKKGLVMVVICAVVGVLGLITVILGIAGEASAAQSLKVPTDGVYCEYRTTPALGCGIVAALFALTAQLVVTTATGCCGCCRTRGIPTETKQIVALVLSALSWVLVIIDVVLFIVGAAANVGGTIDAPDDGKCVVAPGSDVFAAATALSLVAVGFQITSYILQLQATAAGSGKPLAEAQSGIVMGQPMRPEPQNTDQRAAAGDEPPSPAPTSLSESRAEPTSQV